MWIERVYERVRADLRLCGTVGSAEQPGCGKVEVVDNQLRAFARPDLIEIAALARHVLRAISPLRLGGRRHPRLIARDATAQHLVERDVDEDPQIPVRVELRALQKTAVGDQDGVAGRGASRPVQHSEAGEVHQLVAIAAAAAGAEGHQQLVADRVVVPVVQVVALGGVLRKPGPQRDGPLEVVDADPDHLAGRTPAQRLREHVGQRRLAGRRAAVDRHPHRMRALDLERGVRQRHQHLLPLTHEILPPDVPGYECRAGPQWTGPTTKVSAEDTRFELVRV